MQRSLIQWLEVAANAGILLVAVAIVGTTLRGPSVASRANARAAEHEIKVGDKLSITGVSWQAASASVVLVFRRDCGFCVQSVPLYQQLSETAASAGVQMIALLPPPIDDGQRFLESEGIRASAVKAVTETQPRLTKSPMLILVDQSGTVGRVWGGKLPETLHPIILQALRSAVAEP